MAKGDNAILPLYEDADHLTASVTGGTVTGGRFVAVSGNLQSGPLLNAAAPASDGGNIQVATCGAGAKALGVSKYDGAVGDKIGVYAGRFIVPMTPGATLTAGTEVESDASGKPIPLASGRSNGIVVQGATTSGTAYIRLH